MKHLKHLTAALLAAVMAVGTFAVTAVTADAKTTTLSDGTVFDSAYYSSAYSDLQAAFGTDYNALLNHYLTYGASEGRAASGRTVTLADGTLFDADYYAETYADVNAAFGTDFGFLLNHYLTYGIREGRMPSANGLPTDVDLILASVSTASTAASTGSTTSGSSHQISGFSIIYQYPELPTGCESVAATMLINYYGFSADKLDLADNYLPKVAAVFYYDANGNKIGPDMENYFVGDPRGTGHICGVPAIMTEVDTYLAAQGSDLRSVNLTGISLDDLYAYIDNDTPVMVWVTIYMANRRTTKGWYTEDGRWMEYATNDHGAVLIGYTDTTVTIADPISGIVEYSRSQFEKVFTSRGNQALIIQ
ncbi:MAG: C39 family peptidase [Lachnospiraceae bacterium]|nr:C39 family peptidase [Lachnospiraceae bacterium]